MIFSNLSNFLEILNDARRDLCTLSSFFSLFYYRWRDEKLKLPCTNAGRQKFMESSKWAHVSRDCVG